MLELEERKIRGLEKINYEGLKNEMHMMLGKLETNDLSWAVSLKNFQHFLDFEERQGQGGAKVIVYNENNYIIILFVKMILRKSEFIFEKNRNRIKFIFFHFFIC